MTDPLLPSLPPSLPSQPVSSRPTPLLSNYPDPSSAGRYDEMFAAAMQPRPHWQATYAQLLSDDAHRLRARVDSVQRQIRENGVTFNAWADEQDEQRPWDLNLLPLILPADEWAQIEAAVIQRATLFNRILCDLYGPQLSITQGLLPAALIHGNGGFVRPAHGVPHLDGVALHMYAVDLARAPDGRWWAIADRAQTPTGAGYALENRSIISRALPELYRDLKVQPVDGFFATLRDSLAHWGRLCGQQNVDGAPPLGEGEAPLVVLLTPGPAHETYYEQSYLARFLGFPLVEGKDLTVRGGVVWLKTLAGLQRVHVIFRHVDDESSDPLVLRPNSTVGVVGLLDAARRGTVVLANAIGASLLESGALLGYLPRIAEAWLGETLRIPSVATWWCGEPAALDHVVSRLPELMIKPAYPQLQFKPVFGADLTPGERYTLVRDMRIRAHHYVAQEMVHLSQAPILTNAQNSDAASLQAAPVGLRVYACATPQGYVVMPGGLARVATGRDTRILNMQRGGAAKDTWVLPAEFAFTAPTPPLTNPAVTLARGNEFLASRMVENLFWYGRYEMRSDHLARLTRTALDFLLKLAPENRGGEWPIVQGLCLRYGLLGAPSGSQHGGFVTSVPLHSDAEVEYALLQSVVLTEKEGLASSLQQLYAIAGKLRERLSLDNWRTLNDLVKLSTDAVRHPTLADAANLLDAATRSLMTLSGFTLDGMTRDNAWRFMAVGRLLERLKFMCNVLRHAMTMPVGGSLDWLLELADSIVTYRARYMAQPEWRTVLDLLVRDDTNPRSLAFLLEGLTIYLNKLTQHYGPCGADVFIALQSALSQLDPDQDLDPKRLDRPALGALLKQMEQACSDVSDQIGMRFFSHSLSGDAPPGQNNGSAHG